MIFCLVDELLAPSFGLGINNYIGNIFIKDFIVSLKPAWPWKFDRVTARGTVQ